MRRSRGLTRVELITVIAVIVIGLVLALPAIQSSREEARKLTCRRNLAVIGLALHNYHDANMCLPPGWILKDDAAKAGPGRGWMVPILVYNVGEIKIYSEIDPNKPAFVDAHPKYSQSFDVYRCPSDETDPSDKKFGGYGISNYAGVYGDDKFPGQDEPANDNPSGGFYRNSCIRFQKASWGWINDGLSYTLLVGERCDKTGSGIWPAARSNAQAVDVVGSCHDDYRINKSKGAFSSHHAGGAHFLYGDGSVRFLSENIESSAEIDPPKGLYQKLANRRDGQKFDVSESATDYYFFGKDPGFKMPKK